jgi:GR25 family glycosyltransferase involved in LPS biosynthesis
MTIQTTFVINLKRSTDRMRDFDENARALGMRYTRWEGTDGRSMTKQQREAVASRWCSSGVTCTPGVIGCYLSHKSLWERIASNSDSPNDWYMIFEDDALPTCEFIDNVDDILSDVASWQESYGPRPEFVHLAPFVTGNDRITRNLWRTTIVPNMSAYMISGAGAHKLLRFMSDPIGTHVDVTITLERFIRGQDAIAFYVSRSYITNNDARQSSISTNTYPKLLADAVVAYMQLAGNAHAHVVLDSVLFTIAGVPFNATLIFYIFLMLWLLKHKYMRTAAAIAASEVVYSVVRGLQKKQGKK